MHASVHTTSLLTCTPLFTCIISCIRMHVSIHTITSLSPYFKTDMAQRNCNAFVSMSLSPHIHLFCLRCRLLFCECRSLLTYLTTDMDSCIISCILGLFLSIYVSFPAYTSRSSHTCLSHTCLSHTCLSHTYVSFAFLLYGSGLMRHNVLHIPHSAYCFTQTSFVSYQALFCLMSNESRCVVKLVIWDVYLLSDQTKGIENAGDDAWIHIPSQLCQKITQKVSSHITCSYHLASHTKLSCVSYLSDSSYLSDMRRIPCVSYLSHSHVWCSFTSHVNLTDMSGWLLLSHLYVMYLISLTSHLYLMYTSHMTYFTLLSDTLVSFVSSIRLIVSCIRLYWLASLRIWTHSKSPNHLIWTSLLMSSARLFCRMCRSLPTYLTSVKYVNRDL